MKKSESQAIGYLIIIAAIVAFLSWLYQTIGMIGIILLGVAIISGLFLRSKKKKERYLNEYYDAVRCFLNTRLSPDEARPYGRTYSKSDFERWSLLRCLQIMRDSIDIALTSKKRDTAESRMELAGDKYQEIITEHKKLITPEILDEIGTVYRDAQSQFFTKLFVNVSTGQIEKAEKLKTEKSKIKYLNQALETIEEAINSGQGDVAKFEERKREISEKISAFGSL